MPLYLIHFDRPLAAESLSPFGPARHYLGFAKSDIDARFKKHLAGDGATILKHAIAAGITLEIVRRWPEGNRADERKLKAGSLTTLCPLCRELRLADKRVKEKARRLKIKGGDAMKN